MEVEADLHKELGFGVVRFVAIGIASNYFVSAKIEKMGQGSRVSVKTNNPMITQQDRFSLGRWRPRVLARVKQTFFVSSLRVVERPLPSVVRHRSGPLAGRRLPNESLGGHQPPSAGRAEVFQISFRSIGFDVV
jgi:hypothetical protein